jgi:hypothetical protein
VNDFPNQKNSIVGKNTTRGVGKVNRSLDPITKPELLSETQCGISNLENPASGADFLDNRTLVVIRDLGLDALHYLRRAHIDSLSLRGSWHRKI